MWSSKLKGDPIPWLLSQQDTSGRWKIEPQGQPSKWVTLPACIVLKQVYTSYPALHSHRQILAASRELSNKQTTGRILCL